MYLMKGETMKVEITLTANAHACVLADQFDRLADRLREIERMKIDFPPEQKQIVFDEVTIFRSLIVSETWA